MAMRGVGRINRDSPRVRLALVITAADAAQVVGIAIVTVIGVLSGHYTRVLFFVASVLGYVLYLATGLRGLAQVVDEEWLGAARKALALAPPVAIAIWLPLNYRVPFLEWTPLLFPYMFVLGTVEYLRRRRKPTPGDRFR